MSPWITRVTATGITQIENDTAWENVRGIDLMACHQTAGGQFQGESKDLDKIFRISYLA
jgi:hypothetical protein